MQLVFFKKIRIQYCNKVKQKVKNNRLCLRKIFFNPLVSLIIITKNLKIDPFLDSFVLYICIYFERLLLLGFSKSISQSMFWQGPVRFSATLNFP